MNPRLGSLRLIGVWPPSHPNLREDPKRTELDARFRALESEEGEDDVNDELAALKAKLGG